MFTKTLQLFRMYRDFLSSKISQISSKSSQWGETCGRSECKKSFSTLIDLDKHIKGHTEAQTELFSCSDCTQCFSQLSFLNSHWGKPFSCSEFNKPFSKWGNMEKHVRAHMEPKPFGCLQCYKSFSDSKSLKRHARHYNMLLAEVGKL